MAKGFLRVNWRACGSWLILRWQRPLPGTTGRVAVSVLANGTTPLVAGLGSKACQRVRVPYGRHSMFRVLSGCHGLRRTLSRRLVNMYSTMSVTKLPVHGPAGTHQCQETLPDPVLRPVGLAERVLVEGR
ncbi:hypothetical protein TcYC6_0085080 [Trypanosoma cruzi]|nr:hypothetical protein TcYC6_0085080 [Trypanosoma cruzi]